MHIYNAFSWVVMCGVMDNRERYGRGFQLHYRNSILKRKASYLHTQPVNLVVTQCVFKDFFSKNFLY